MTKTINDSVSDLPAQAENISIAGFNKFSGPFYRLPDDGDVRRFAFVALPHHMNGAGTVHGGLLMTFADISMSRTSRLISGAKSCSTVALNCDFVGPGRLGDLIESRVRATRQTRTLIFLSAELSTASHIVMTATGLWKIIP
jgi:acyl-coenzyme A thioesterase PaaI-like protein